MGAVTLLTGMHMIPLKGSFVLEWQTVLSVYPTTAMSHSSRLLAALALATITMVPASLCAQTQAQAPEHLGDLKTVTGKVYRDAKVMAVDPDGLRLLHDSGVSKIAFVDLPGSVRSRFPHDPDKAAEFAAKAEAANREAIQYSEQERARVEYDERCRRAGLPMGFLIPNEGPLTIAQVKGRWLLDNSANPPTFGDRDRTAREAAIENRKQLILSGVFDRDAEKIALRHNLDWYLHHDEVDKAELARRRLADMQQEESKEAELKVLERLAGSVAKLAAESAYRSDLAAELARFRCELERAHPSGAHVHVSQ